MHPFTIKNIPLTTGNGGNFSLPIRQLILALGSAMFFMAATGAAAIDGFDTDAAGAQPKRWKTGVTGSGNPIWTVVAEPTAPSQPNAFKQSGVGDYPWAVTDSAPILNGQVEVKFKAVSGQVDQAAGIVWRFKNKDSYYITRANILENNVRIYTVVDGYRREIGSANIPLAPKKWHTVGIRFAGKHMTVLFNQRPVIELDDSTYSEAGAVGLWTKEDSVTLFDDFSVTPLP